MIKPLGERIIVEKTEKGEKTTSSGIVLPEGMTKNITKFTVVDPGDMEDFKVGEIVYMDSVMPDRVGEYYFADVSFILGKEVE